ncbi:MAG: peptide chain release factor N(5)-glutamine methyltransferase, partial [Planctomycetota bacterium]
MKPAPPPGAAPVPVPPAAEVISLLAEGESRLRAHGIESARLDAEVLLAHALGVGRGRLAMLLAGGGARRVAEGPRELFRRMLARRCRHEPVAYLVGRREFWSLDLEVTPAVLIPRPETERVVRAALELLPPAGGEAPPVADVGTGSGAIAVALAVERPELRVVGIDISREALAVARRNARRHRVARRVTLVQADLLEPFLHAASDRAARERFLMVVSNPPYLSRGERGSLMPDVARYEPQEALFADEDGMGVVARLVPQAARALEPGGWLVMETTVGRAAATLRLLGGGPWRDVA